MYPELFLFRRQYLQLVEPDFLSYPSQQLLRDLDSQEWLYKKLFDADSNNGRLPSGRHQLEVLKRLIHRIEQAIEDPDEDDISDDLMSRLTTLIAADLPSESVAVQQKTYVTFTCRPPDSAVEENEVEPIITLLEHRHLISGSQTTGYRTWEAALHLGSFLLTPQGSNFVRGKSILELGAGTGFLSILCAKHLDARHVTATDGDEGVVEALRENLFLNDLDDEKRVLTSVLRWGHGLKVTWVEEDCEAWPYDIVLGADITYDPKGNRALVGTLRMIFDMRSGVQVVISGAVRNPETYGMFRQMCLRNNFEVDEIEFEAKPLREQQALFYASAMPLKLLRIVRSMP